MSWKLSRPDVKLRVARFRPEISPASAGLTECERERLREKRSKECARVEPAPEFLGWYDIRRGLNDWLYGSRVKLYRVIVPEVTRAESKHACSGIECIECWNAGQRYDDYLKAKADPWR